MVKGWAGVGRGSRGGVRVFLGSGLCLPLGRSPGPSLGLPSWGSRSGAFRSSVFPVFGSPAGLFSLPLPSRS